MYEKSSNVPLQEVRSSVAPTRKTRQKGRGAAQVRELYQPVLERLAQGEKEEWRDVPGYEGVLIASDQGRVARLQGFHTGQGYLGVSVVSGIGGHSALNAKHDPSREGHTISIHRIIAVTFVGDPPEGREFVNHKDGNKANNRVSNLEWCTIADNLAHARRTGLSVTPLRSLTEAQYAEARKLFAEGWKQLHIAQHMGINVGAVHHVVKRSKRGLIDGR